MGTTFMTERRDEEGRRRSEVPQWDLRDPEAVALLTSIIRQSGMPEGSGHVAFKKEK